MTAVHSAVLTTLDPSSMRSLFPRVVFGIDFGSASLAAARWASEFIAPHCEAIVSHVASADAALIAEDSVDQQASLRRLVPALSGGLGGFAATLDSKLVRTVVRIGRPSHWLAAIAGGAEASLIVLGRRGDANRKTIGEPNVIERVARRASCSVLVVPEGVTTTPQSVVAAIDDSTFAARVVSAARRLARLHELPLTLLHVLSPSNGVFDRRTRHVGSGRPVWVSPGEQPGVVSARTSAWLDDLARAPDSLSNERLEIAVGDVPREIISSARAAGAALVVVGIRGADAAVPGSIGSVVRELLARSPVPILAIN